MPQPVKISDALLDAAREAAPLANRSVAAQIEHWAGLGRAIEGSLTADQSMTLKRGIQEPQARPYVSSESVEQIRQRVINALTYSLTPAFRTGVRDEVNASARPTYGLDDAFPGTLVRRDPDGTLTPGRLVGRQFVPIVTASDESASAVAKDPAKPRTGRSPRQRTA